MSEPTKMERAAEYVRSNVSAYDQIVSKAVSEAVAEYALTWAQRDKLLAQMLAELKEIPS